jgi:competence protein ComEC
MKLPAVAIACAFALGIAIGFRLVVANFASSAQFLAVALSAVIVLFVACIVLVSRSHLWTATSLSLATWLALGICGASIANQPKPKNYILNLIDRGEIDLHAPLRWHGILRKEPATLPWGTAYDVELTGVDFEERTVPVQGGLRATYSPHSEESAAINVHAGDGITIVTQARLPQMFRDEGAFDRRAYLRRQGVDLTATLRSAALLEKVSTAKVSPSRELARIRHELREALSNLFPSAPDEAGVLRAMLLGDRSFLEHSESLNFQKTGVFHVLVVAGLHVGAFAAFLFWLARKLRLSRLWTSFTVILCVLAYVAVVEQRPPVLRAALMTIVVVVALSFFRRVELLNSVAIAAVILLVSSPALIADSSFQLSFLSMFCIAGLAAPWIEKSIELYARGMRGWRDVTRDVSHPPTVAQFRIDLRSVAAWIEARLPAAIASRSTGTAARGLSLSLRVAEMLVLTLVLQIGMLPLLARDFHRVTLSGPLANLVAVPLTGILVPLGFATLILDQMFHRAAMILAAPLCRLTALLLHTVAWIANAPRWSYRIPSPPLWLMLFFFASALIVAFTLRCEFRSSLRCKRISFVFALAAAASIATFPFSPRWQHGSLELTVLDVGQGDSLFLVSPAGHTILVDAGGSFTDPYHRNESRGPDPGEDAVSPYLWSRGFKQIEIVALTHAHQDHIAGLTAIFENFPVKTLWIGREVASRQQEQLEALAASKGTRIVHELRGNHFDWDGAQIEFLWPQIVPQEVASSAKNDDSLVFRVTFGQRSFLLAGDAEKAAEQSILAESDALTLRSDVLKVGHHGSTIPQRRTFWPPCNRNSRLFPPVKKTRSAIRVRNLSSACSKAAFPRCART